MWIRGYRTRGTKLASLLHWDTLETPSILRQRDGSLLAVLALESPDLDSALDVELVTQATQLNALFRRYGAGWGFQTEVRRWPMLGYPPVSWSQWLPARVDAERRQQWAEGAHFTHTTHLSLVYRPLRPLLTGWRRLVFEHLPEDEAPPEALAVQDFAEEITRIVGMLKACGIAATVLEEDDLLTYLHSTVSTKVHRVAIPHPACYLNRYLTDDDVTPGIVVRLGDWYLACVSPHAWTTATTPGMFSVLHDLPFAYRACVRYVPMDTRAAIAQARKEAHRWEAKEVEGQGRRSSGSTVTDRSAREHSQEAQEAWRRLANRDITYGHLTTTVVVWDTDLPAVRRKAQLVEGAFNAAGMIAKAETLNTMDAWVGTLPGDMVANARSEPLHSFNVAHCFPVTQPWAGQQATPHLQGPALCHVTGPGLCSLALSLYEGDVGHFGLIGSTGDGKSTLLNYLCIEATKYTGQEICIFDKEYAALRLTGMMGGGWYDLGRTPLQPLARLDAPGEIPWAVDWLEALLLQERVAVTPAIKEELHACLLRMAVWDGSRRTMTTLASLVEDEMTRSAIRLYTQQGPYGQLTDGATDPIADARWLCFELRSLLETPRLLNAILPALFHRLEQRLVGPPVLYVLHEAWIAFNTPYWQERLQAWLKGLRTRNGAVGMASQSLADAVNSPIMPAIFDNVASWMFTPNSKALSEEEQRLYRTLGLNARQCEVIALGTKKQDYYLVQASGCSRFRLDLGPLALAACATPYAEEIAPLQAQIAAQGAQFGETYLREKGLL